jgi:hypothetical protein
MNFKLFSSFSALAFLLFSCQPKPTGKVEITNPSKDSLIDAQVVLTRASVESAIGQVPCCKVLVLKDASGKYIPSQLDDLDGDGKWDELAMVYNLAPNQTVSLNVYLYSKENAPEYVKRTQANFGKKVGNAPVKYITHEVLKKAPLPRGKGYPYKTDGPTWESDKAGYRHYFDGRNCRDFFCKIIPQMVLDTVGIWPDGTIGDTYHKLKSWGRDVLGVGQSFGLGGIAIMNEDTIVRLGVLNKDTVDNSDSTVFTLVANGPVRSIIRFNHYGWEVGKSKINVQQTVSIWAGRYVYENEVQLFGDSVKKALITGLVHSNDSNGLTVYDYKPGFTAFVTHDMQTYNRQYYMGLALFVPQSSFIQEFNTPSKGDGLLYTYCAKLKAPFGKSVKYYAMAACELQNTKLRSKREFMELVDNEALILNTPVVVKISKF